MISMDIQTFFTAIYRQNAWGHRESRSGPGSARIQTEHIVDQLPGLFASLNVDTVLDIPCGDFEWMRFVDLGNVNYIGADIVPDAVANNQKYASDHIRFVQLDVVSGDLPKVDLVMVRDCLVHFSFELALRALNNIVRSGSRYLLATTFSGRTSNVDILTGQWRPLNLELPPFNLLPPVQLINEGCTESGGEFSDKCLGLWEIEAITPDLSPSGGQQPL